MGIRRHGDVRDRGAGSGQHRVGAGEVEFTEGTATYGARSLASPSYPVDAYFAPGETEAQARLVLRADDVQEATETLSFSVVEALGATVDGTPAVVTVLDDDRSVASITPVDPVGVESDGVLDFAIELDAPSESEVTVDWSLRRVRRPPGTISTLRAVRRCSLPVRRWCRSRWCSWTTCWWRVMRRSRSS